MSSVCKVWRLMSLAIRDLRLTVMLRSPDASVVRDHDNLTASRILRLPTDMPNMDVELPQIEIKEQFGSVAEFGEILKRRWELVVGGSARVIGARINVWPAQLPLPWLAAWGWDLVLARRPHWLPRLCVCVCTHA